MGSPRGSPTRCGCWRASGRWASCMATTPVRRHRHVDGVATIHVVAAGARPDDPAAQAWQPWSVSMARWSARRGRSGRRRHTPPQLPRRIGPARRGSSRRRPGLGCRAVAALAPWSRNARRRRGPGRGDGHCRPSLLAPHCPRGRSDAPAWRASRRPVAALGLAASEIDGLRSMCATRGWRGGPGGLASPPPRPTRAPACPTERPSVVGPSPAGAPRQPGVRLAAGRAPALDRHPGGALDWYGADAIVADPAELAALAPPERLAAPTELAVTGVPLRRRSPGCPRHGSGRWRTPPSTTAASMPRPPTSHDSCSSPSPRRTATTGWCSRSVSPSAPSSTSATSSSPTPSASSSR